MRWYRKICCTCQSLPRTPPSPYPHKAPAGMYLSHVIEAYAMVNLWTRRCLSILHSGKFLSKSKISWCLFFDFVQNEHILVLFRERESSTVPSWSLTLLCSVVTGVPLVWCFSRSRLGVPGKSEGTIFTPVQCQIGYYEPVSEWIPYPREYRIPHTLFPSEIVYPPRKCCIPWPLRE